jgi:hypothetical protein
LLFRVVAESREFSGLKTIKSPSVLRIETWTTSIQPSNRLFGDFIPMDMVREFILAMGDEIWKNE